MSIFDLGEDIHPPSRRSTAYFSAAEGFAGNAPHQEITDDSSGLPVPAPKGILTGGRKRGGVKWRDENASDGAFAERIKHFDFLDSPQQISAEQEYGADAFSVPDDTREHPWYTNQKAMMSSRTAENTSRRSRQLQRMVMELPRAEANANTYAQDLGTDELLERPKGSMTEAEDDAFAAESERARAIQNRALGVAGYDSHERGRIARRANASRTPAKPGLFSRMIDTVGLGKLFGTSSSRDRTFDAVPRRRQSSGWFSRLFGASRSRPRI